MPAADEAKPRHRSGAVARMLRMPVATLRVWERRYGLSSPALSPSGQRLYSAADVRRLAMVKQLCDLGHAIGGLAPLTMAQLQAVAATHAGVLAGGRGAGQADMAVPAAMAWRVAVVGPVLAKRLQQNPCLRRWDRPVQWLGPFADVVQAASALQHSTADALVIEEPRLHEGWLAGLQASAPGLAALPKAVLYRFAADSHCASLASAGIRMLRGPQNHAVLAQWLHDLLSAQPRAAAAAPQPGFGASAIAPRRWDDAALADFAGLSSTIACECPRHVAELLMQLSHFEAYSAECRQQSAADAELHAYLGQVAGDARARFEAALLRVALHEGLILPP